MTEKPYFLAVVGPTASGKSALAEALALRLSGEIISCDSMQIYRGMDIGTAKPTPAERARVPYHLVDILSPFEDFSAADYAQAADAAIADVRKRARLPILCGGTGLYLETLLRGAPRTPAADPVIRERLAAEAEKVGSEALYARLAAVDPVSAAAIHPNNVRRVLRALEIAETTGLPKSEWDRQNADPSLRYRAAVICLTFKDRNLLYERIEKRVTEMFRAGLIQETRALQEAGVFERSATAAAAIGYKEILPYLSGQCDLETARNTLILSTKHYAKRQITWFSARPYIHKLPVDADGKMRNFEEIVNNALKLKKEIDCMI